MKKLIVFALVLLIGMFPLIAEAAGSKNLRGVSPDFNISTSNKCSVTPTIYSSERYRDLGSSRAYDISKGEFSANVIQRNRYSKDYGLYFKFTPSRVDDGYYIYRIDYVVCDKSGDVIYFDGFDDSMTCEYGYYWYWDFLSLQDMFDAMISKYGYVVKGTYTMHIYFNRQWAGRTYFKVGN